MTFLPLLIFAAACTAVSPPFSHSEPITITGYSGDAMEPFISADGSLLFFNNRNEPPTDTNIYYAQRRNETQFQFMGEVKGVNTTALDAVPSMDTYGRFYFISTRDYKQTLSTVFEATFRDGAASNITHVSNLSANKFGHIDFDAEIAPDGNTLYYVEGIFNGGGPPKSALILVAHRTAKGFIPDPNTKWIMSRVNDGFLQYAPDSRDGYELFFTRVEKFLFSAKPVIYSASRSDPNGQFGNLRPVDAIKGFAEAPTLSADGCTLYYHALNNGRYGIWRVTRGVAAAPPVRLHSR